MFPENILKELQTASEQINHIVKWCKQWEKQDTQNISDFQRRLKFFDSLNPDNIDISKLKEALQQLKNWKIETMEQQKTENTSLTRKFGGHLEDELKSQGLHCLQKSNGLAVDVFLITWDSEKEVRQSSYGPEEEKLVTCTLDIKRIAQTIQKEKQTLGSDVSDEDYVAIIKKAYNRAVSEKESNGVPIITVMAETAFLLQKKTFFSNPIKDHFRGYARKDFSYDLYRYRNRLIDGGIKLKIASLAKTDSRHKFLWVPSKESVDNGSRYSEVFIERTT